ncbi:hypothetical protein T4D_8713 [Trichinella pseudospiralis]|uniref:Uncharacterized protein n=1 Tax=Trichinella pseudospiralis TaxID=6337 RepID=A0A0V1FXV7_TRIPS|nr:hypothetical protein T4D_8713 [Trichinella pseudospiralis]
MGSIKCRLQYFKVQFDVLSFPKYIAPFGNMTEALFLYMKTFHFTLKSIKAKQSITYGQYLKCSIIILQTRKIDEYYC